MALLLVSCPVTLTAMTIFQGVLCGSQYKHCLKVNSENEFVVFHHCTEDIKNNTVHSENESVEFHHSTEAMA